jgi:hypothetical protein
LACGISLRDLDLGENEFEVGPNELNGHSRLPLSPARTERAPGILYSKHNTYRRWCCTANYIPDRTVNYIPCPCARRGVPT